MSERSVDEQVRLPRPPGALRRTLAAHPVAVDVFIVAGYLIGTVGGALLLDFALANADPAAGPGAPFSIADLLSGFGWVPTLVRTLLVAAALFFRRRFPVAGVVVVSLCMFGEQSAFGFPNAVALMFVLYAVPVYRSVAAGWLAYAIATVAGFLQAWASFTGFSLDIGGSATSSVFAADVTPIPTFGQFLGVSGTNAVWYLAVLMLGISVGNRRRYLDAVIDRAHQLVRERYQLAQLAVAEERSRIAREMHDIVAHSVSVMIALSEGAARTVETAPDAARDALDRSAETGRTALAEMRRLLGALNSSDDAPELGPQPGVSDLPELVESFREAGLQVSLDVSGDFREDRGRELALYRIVQEGLTNVLRYAGQGARARVTVSGSPDGAHVTVRDFGPAPGVTRPSGTVGSGRGLAGLAERARVFGGSTEAGPAGAAAGEGWQLRAVLPIDSATDAGNSDGRSTAGSVDSATGAETSEGAER